MPTPKKKAPRPEVPVIRDATFHRAVADKAIVIDLGRDVELALLQGSPTVKKMIDLDEENEQAQLEGGFTEVVRLRLAAPVAFNIAVNILDTLVRAGKVKSAGLLDLVSRMVADETAEESETDRD